MRIRPTLPNLTPGVFGCAVVVAVALAPMALGQTASSRSAPGGINAFDRYGNARPTYPGSGAGVRAPARRYPGTDVARNRLHGQAASTVLIDPFALGGSNRFRSPVAGIAGQSAVHKAFNRYGGFRKREGRGDEVNFSTMLTRRQDLVRATSINAPIRRAIWNRGSPAAIPISVEDVPFIPGETGGPALRVESLGQHLRTILGASFLRARDQGWSLFREERYRRAARAFEAAMTVQPDDVESRLGVLFCQLSLGAMRTSLALLGQIERRPLNPFLDDLNVVEHYGSELQSRRVRLRTQLFAQAGGDRESAALHAFTLWYLGGREEALVAAETLQSAFPDSVSTGWHAKMVAAAKASSSADQLP